MLRKGVIFFGIILILVAVNAFADENTDQAWQALTKKDYVNARAFIKNCINNSRDKALKQQRDLDILKTQKDTRYKILTKGVISREDDEDVSGIETIESNKELNDIATVYFIEAEILLKEGKIKQAKKKYEEAVNNYKDGYCWDPKGWYWKVSDVAKDKLDTIGTQYDYKDYTSETLTIKAWESLDKSDYKGVELYCRKVIKLYSDKANKMQTQLNDFAENCFIPYYWALNDVGTCYFILGEAYRKQNDSVKANEAYRIVVNRYKFAQCWDPHGWYWKVAKASEENLNGTR